MLADDADRLGPKGHVYVELVREQWRAPLERGSARRAILIALFGVALVGLGVAGAFMSYFESFALIGIGLFGFVSSFRDLTSLRPEFEEARRIGWVEPSLDDSSVIVGEPATFRAVLHARRALKLEGVTVLAEARRWSGATPGEVVTSMTLPVPLSSASITSGDDWRTSATFRIPDSAPPSFYSSYESVRWTLTMEMTFANETPWRRAWPMLVFPHADGA
jgi:hypothetical protein